MNIMASGSFRLKGRFFDESKLKVNKHELSLMERVSYPTMLKYMGGDDDIRRFSGEVLYAILIKGMGYSESEVEDMRIGDVFNVKAYNGKEVVE